MTNSQNINYVVTKPFQIKIDSSHFVIPKDTVLLVTENNDSNDNIEPESIEFQLFMGNNNKKYYDEYFLLDKQIVEENMITFSDYQQQFSHLTNEKDYFGQIPTDHYPYFSYLENGEQVHYQKIDEYIKKDGTKINAVKRKLNEYFFLDNEDYCRGREFAYFNMDTPVLYQRGWQEEENKEKNTFYPPVQHAVSIRFIQLPQMFEVVECFLNNIPLNDELKKIYNDYKQLRYELENDGWGEGDSDIYYQYVLPLIKQKNIEEHKNEIMKEIERETALFKNNLISQRLNF